MFKNYLILFLLFFSLPSSIYAVQKPNKEIHWIDSTLKHMTIDEKIGQLFMIAAYSNKTNKYEDQLEHIIRQYHIGGLIFFQGDPIKQATLTNRYQKAAKYPLIIGMDAEHGVGWRLQSAMEFPKMLIVGAAGNDSLAYRLGATIARHCKEIGIHINFAPVVDINNNLLNPVIGMRSFGENPENVSKDAIMYIKGSLSENILPVAKHFPGHGDTDTDSHDALPQIKYPFERLDSLELYPYKRLIKEYLPAVMIAHLNVPALDSGGIPASLSPLVINQYLKKELGFTGLCFTDAMNMKGVTGDLEPGEAELKALIAGNDILLFPGKIEKAIEKIKQAVNNGTINLKTIDEKCRKILAAKYKYALPNIRPLKTAGLEARLNKPEDFALKQNLYKSAITLIKNNDSILPLKRLDTLNIACLNFGEKAMNPFQIMLSKYAPVYDYSTESKLNEHEINNLQTTLENYNCIIIFNASAVNDPARNFGYTENLASLIKSLEGKRIILCHPATPYGLSSYLELPLDAILLCYDNHTYAQQYAAQAIFGGIAISGSLPVGINPEFPSGTAIKTIKTRLGYLIPEMCGISSVSLAGIDTLCEQAIRIEATPGCQVLVAKNGNIIYNKAFGFNTYKKEIPDNTSNIYDLASVTKITATLPAIMKLYDENKLKLDTALSAYYTPLKTTNKKDLTVREILYHNSGLKTFIPFFSDAIDKKSLPGPLFSITPTKNNPVKLKDKLYVNPNYHFKDSTFSNIPKPDYDYISQGLYVFHGYQDTILKTILRSDLNKKKEYAYSDLGFILLKYAVEEITGKGIDDFCREIFYKKLGASDTDFQGSQRLNEKYIVPSSVDNLYRKTEIRGSVHDPGAAILGGIAGHAGLFSTAEDLAKIMEMYLNKGIYGGELYFSPSTVTTFTQRSKNLPQNRRALGFDKPEPDTTKSGPTCPATPQSSFGHTGFTGTMTWCDPDNNLIYIFLSNRTYPDEFNTKLSEQNIRTKIQEVIYNAIKK